MIFFFFELFGSYFSNSLTLFSDAMHMFQDLIALGMAVFAFQIVKKPKDSKLTFGYKRAEVISAFLNGLGLFLVSLFIFYEAIIRFSSEPEIQSDIMLVVSVVGLIINLSGIFILKEVQNDNINAKGAFLHVLSDTFGSVGAIVASVLIIITGMPIFDLIVSLIITVLILISSFSITKQALNILMERTPGAIDVKEIEQRLLQIKGIKNVHDTHAWSVTTDQYNFSCHIEITKETEPCKILNIVTNLLTKDYFINHTTVQVEHEDKFIECGSC